MPVALRIWGEHLRTRFPLKALYVSGLLFFALLIGLVTPLKAIATKHVATALETRIPRAALHPTVPISGMIILGGTDTRVHEAVTLAKNFPDAPIILSGPGATQVAAATAHLPAATKLLIDRRAKNTYENAVYSRELANPQDGECWVLITSAMHMPRALGSFRAAGMTITPWPVFDTPLSVEERNNWVQHELMGLIWYWALGRTREIYPAHRSSACHPKTSLQELRVSWAEDQAAGLSNEPRHR